MTTTVSTELFGHRLDGSPVSRFTLSSESMNASILDLGIRLQSLTLNLAGGIKRECVLGFNSLEPYLTDATYLGAVVGPYGNRVRGGAILIDDIRYQLDQNDGDNHLHGGHVAFHNQCWTTELIDSGVVFFLVSPAGQGGYPAELTTRVTVRLIDAELTYSYEASSSAPTHINPTNHAYFNLCDSSLSERSSVLEHTLQVSAPRFLETDNSLLPTGKILSVAGTPFDFTEARMIGSAFDQNEVAAGDGYDLCYVLESRESSPVAARLVSPDGLIALSVATDQPGLQFYTDKHTGICLETQHFPDSPNIPTFPATLLAPGQDFSSTTIFSFSG